MHIEAQASMHVSHHMYAAMYAKQGWPQTGATTWGVFGSLVKDSKGKRQGCAATPRHLSARSAMLSNDRLEMKWLHAK